MHERLRYPDLLLVATRVLSERPVEVEFEPFRDALRERPIDAPAKIREVREQLSPGEPGIQRELARQVAREAMDRLHLLVAVVPKDQRPAGSGPNQVKQQPDGRRLTGAVRPKKAENLALVHRQVQLEDAPSLSVGLR